MSDPDPDQLLRITPLPPDDQFLLGSTLHDAYESILRFRDHQPEMDRQALLARWLGHLLREVPVKENLAQDILDRNDDAEKLGELAGLYMGHLLGFFRRQGGRTPAPSEHPSRPSFDLDVELNKSVHQTTTRDHGTAKQVALYRDRYCGIKGGVDWNYWQKAREMGMWVEGAPLTTTNAAHIIPFHLNSASATADERKNAWSAGVLAVLKRVGGIAPEDLRGSNINRLSNIITMDLGEHAFFDSLLWWMEPADNIPLGLPEEVTFTSPDDANLELPDPRFIAIHAACCRAAHLSGAAEYADQMYRTMENTLVLAPDGASADMLHFALSHLARADPAS